MKGIISQLHTLKGGSTNKTSDQRPAVLLNSGYQLHNYIINERLKTIVEQTNVLIKHIKLPAKRLDYFLRSNKSNINRVRAVWGQAGSKCQHQHARKCILSLWHMKPTDKEFESTSIESTTTTETLSMHCCRQLSGM